MSRKDRRKGTNIKGILIKIIEFILLLIILYTGFKIVTWWRENKENKKILEDVSKNVKVSTDENGENKYIVNFENLKEINNETVAWIRVEGTSIEFPIVRTTNNDYYINHSFDRTYNSAGWIFMDYTNKLDGTDKNIIVYGHNRRDKSMFGTLKNILEEDWYNNNSNRIITFITEDEYCKYEVFSVYKTEIEDYYIQTKFKGNEYAEFIKTLKSRSIKDFNVDVTEEDSILTLSTCANNNDYRIVLHAKKIVPI